jgi:hypothetical protein
VAAAVQSLQCAHAAPGDSLVGESLRVRVLFPRSQASQGMGAMPTCPVHDDLVVAVARLDSVAEIDVDRGAATRRASPITRWRLPHGCHEQWWDGVLMMELRGQVVRDDGNSMDWVNTEFKFWVVAGLRRPHPLPGQWPRRRPLQSLERFEGSAPRLRGSQALRIAHRPHE